jgi:hypothetical protein
VKVNNSNIIAEEATRIVIHITHNVLQQYSAESGIAWPETNLGSVPSRPTLMSLKGVQG